MNDITAAKIAANRAARAARTGATGELVLTEKGQMEHMQGSFTKTFCGRKIDRERTISTQQTNFFPCLSCARAANGKI